MRIPGKQIAPSTAMGNLPTIAAPQSLEQYLARINEGLATAEYLVGPTAPFTTIQSAINAALADGASPSNPKVVSVMPAAPYVENLTLTGGGITLVALAPNPQTGSCWIRGSVSIVDPGSANPADFPCYWLDGFYIEGNITISGLPSVNACQLALLGTFVFATGNAVTNGVNGFNLYLGANSVLSASGLAVTSPLGSSLNAAIYDSSVSDIEVNTGPLLGRNSSLGRVVCGQQGYARLEFCSLYASGAAPLQLNATGGQLSRLYNNVFERDGAAGPAVTSVGVTAPYQHGNNIAVGNITDPAFPSAGSIDGYDWEGYADTTRNRNMAASATAADGDLACATALSVRPAQGSMIRVMVNGVEVLVAASNAEKLTSEAYFSGDGGATARSFGQVGTIAAGDLLYWNGSVATYELAATDRIRFDYPVSPYQIN